MRFDALNCNHIGNDREEVSFRCFCREPAVGASRNNTKPNTSREPRAEPASAIAAVGGDGRARYSARVYNACFYVSASVPVERTGREAVRN